MEIGTGEINGQSNILKIRRVSINRVLGNIYVGKPVLIQSDTEVCAGNIVLPYRYPAAALIGINPVYYIVHAVTIHPGYNARGIYPIIAIVKANSGACIGYR